VNGEIPDLPLVLRRRRVYLTNTLASVCAVRVRDRSRKIARRETDLNGGPSKAVIGPGSLSVGSSYGAPRPVGTLAGLRALSDPDHL
jgi:hypothetical protein